LAGTVFVLWGSTATALTFVSRIAGVDIFPSRYRAATGKRKRKVEQFLVWYLRLDSGNSACIRTDYVSVDPRMNFLPILERLASVSKHTAGRHFSNL
jgi:hypothetical protein